MRHEVVALARTAPPEDGAGASGSSRTCASRWTSSGCPRRIDARRSTSPSRRATRSSRRAPRTCTRSTCRARSRLLEWARGAGAQTFVLVSTGGLYALLRRIRSARTPPIACRRLLLPLQVRRRGAARRLRRPPAARRPAAVLRLRRGAAADADRAARRADQCRRGDRVDGDPGLRCNPVHVERHRPRVRAGAHRAGVRRLQRRRTRRRLDVGARRRAGRGDRGRAGGAPPAGRDGGRPGRRDGPNARASSA